MLEDLKIPTESPRQGEKVVLHGTNKNNMNLAITRFPPSKNTDNWVGFGSFYNLFKPGIVLITCLPPILSFVFQMNGCKGN